MRACVVLAAVIAVASGCSGSSAPPSTSTGTSSGTSSRATLPPTDSPTAGPSTTVAPLPTATTSTDFRAAAAMTTVRELAGRIGPREATSPAFRRAASWVEQQLTALGYDVQRQPLNVPAGVSWGVLVDAGRTWNVVARPTGLQPGAPHLVIGAHLDTVPQAPGAEDNASGVGVLLETARLAASAPTRLPVVFVAFAAEEPRGTGDDRHHYGSRAMVARLAPDERTALRGMVALDRVGVGPEVPICHGGLGPATVRSLRRAADSAGVPTRSCGVNRSSDHWSFEKTGLPAARIGSTPFAEYHSARDLPRVVEPAQLGRVGQLLWQWLR